MAEYIERDKVLEAILGLPPKMDEQGYGWLGRMGVWQMIRDFQSADVTPAVHGRWEEVHEWMGDVEYSCSVCGCYAPWKQLTTDQVCTDYCPNCGARMDGKDD